MISEARGGYFDAFESNAFYFCLLKPLYRAFDCIYYFGARIFNTPLKNARSSPFVPL